MSTEPTSGHVDLFERLSELLGTRDIHPDDRAEIQEAFEAAESWDDLPDPIKQKIVELEQLPVQSWDDPSDVPENLAQLS